jgi:hypothetical protein
MMEISWKLFGVIKERLESKILAMFLSLYSIAQVGISKGRMDIAMAQHGLNAP